MGVVDKITALLPWHGERRVADGPAGDRPESAEPRPDLLVFRTSLDRWMGRLRDEPAAFPSLSDIGWIPSADVQENDEEVVVTAEVPGLDADDLDLMLTPGGLIIRGEKREVRQAPPSGVRVTPEGLIMRGRSRESNDERRRDFYVAECRYGSFVRTVPLPPGLDLDRAEARIANGVLTVRFPKAMSRRGARRIPILT